MFSPIVCFYRIKKINPPCVFFVGANTENLPPGVLYKVKASYKYQAEDVDELAFDVGEIMHVVEYDDPEEQVWFTFWPEKALVPNPKTEVGFVKS